MLSEYDTIELISEKFRALLQQEMRNRVRAQDLYDLYYILDVCSLEDDRKMKKHILKRLVEKSSSRNLTVTIDSMANEEIRKRSEEGYKNLPSLVEKDLLDFETIYKKTERFFRSLPW